MVAGVAKIGVSLLLCVSAMSLQAEKISCLIKLAGFKIGSLTAWHENKSGFDQYCLVSDVEINFIMKIKIFYKTVSIYKDNILISSKVSSIIGKSNYSSDTYWDGKKYIINCNTYKYSYRDSSITNPITWSVSKLYFQKPQFNSYVFAETYGKLVKLVKNDGVFVLEIPKSKQVYFYNELGLFTRVEMFNAIKNFEISRNEN